MVWDGECMELEEGVEVEGGGDGIRGGLESPTPRPSH